MSRSPYQRKKPLTANRIANAAVTIVFSFWPALRRPCGAWRPSSQRAVVGVEVLDLVHRRAAGPRRSPTTTIEHERDRPGERGVDVDRLQERPAADDLGEARQVEAEPGAEQDAEGGRVDPVHRALGAARSARAARGARGAVAIRVADPRVLVVAEPFPVAGRLVGDELDLRQPLDALVAVHLGDHDPRRRAVRARERLPVHLEREHHVVEARPARASASRCRAPRASRTGAPSRSGAARPGRAGA